MVKKDKYFASILVIGDEVLSGRTLDTNSNHIAKKIEDLGTVSYTHLTLPTILLV